jgi:hypothetical protein
MVIMTDLIRVILIHNISTDPVGDIHRQVQAFFQQHQVLTQSAMMPSSNEIMFLVPGKTQPGQGPVLW